MRTAVHGFDETGNHATPIASVRSRTKATESDRAPAGSGPGPVCGDRAGGSADWDVGCGDEPPHFELSTWRSYRESRRCARNKEKNGSAAALPSRNNAEKRSVGLHAFRIGHEGTVGVDDIAVHVGGRGSGVGYGVKVGTFPDLVTSGRSNRVVTRLGHGV